MTGNTQIIDKTYQYLQRKSPDCPEPNQTPPTSPCAQPRATSNPGVLFVRICIDNCSEATDDPLQSRTPSLPRARSHSALLPYFPYFGFLGSIYPAPRSNLRRRRGRQIREAGEARGAVQDGRHEEEGAG